MIFSRKMMVTVDVGLHARPAAEFAKVAQGCGAVVTVGRIGGPQVSASSPLRILTLKVGSNEEIVVNIDADDEVRAGEIFDALGDTVR